MHRYGPSRAPSSVRGSSRDVLDAATYKCSVGGEWKPRGSFSHKNHNLLENKVRHGAKITPANTGMICRDHSGEPKLERRCEGPCNQVKTLADFSRSSLSNNGKWCQTCVQWKLSQDDFQAGTEDCVDSTPAPSKKTFSIPIGNDDTDGESVAASSRAGMFSTPSFFLRPSDTNTTSGQLLGVSSRTSGSIPPHLKGFGTEFDGDGGMPIVAEADERHQPDDASSICPDDSASQFAGHPSLLKPAAPRLTADALQEQCASQDQPPMYFNSWDNAGRQHMQRRNGESELGSVRSFETRELSTVVSTEDRRTYAAASNSYHSESARNKKWGKIPRKPQPPPPIPEWNENDVDIEDDGSEPDLP